MSIEVKTVKWLVSLSAIHHGVTHAVVSETIELLEGMTPVDWFIMVSDRLSTENSKVIGLVNFWKVEEEKEQTKKRGYVAFRKDFLSRVLCDSVEEVKKKDEYLCHKDDYTLVEIIEVEK